MKTDIELSTLLLSTPPGMELVKRSRPVAMLMKLVVGAAVCMCVCKRVQCVKQLFSATNWLSGLAGGTAGVEIVGYLNLGAQNKTSSLAAFSLGQN